MARNRNGGLSFEARLSNEKLRKDAEESKGILKGVSKAAVEGGSSIESMMQKLSLAATAYFSAQPLMAFARSILEVRGEIESLEISFTTLLGSKKAADEMFGAIREFAVTTPMTLDVLSKGAQTLLGFGIEAGKVMPLLKQLGDISMGDAQKFQSLSLAFAQASSTGRLMGQDLLQMINAGFNPLNEISKQTGKSIGELKKMMEQGQISVSMLEEAFEAATREGGMFHGMLEKQSHGIKGALSNLQGAWDDMLNDIGSRHQDLIVGSIDMVMKLVKNYEVFIKVLMGVAAAYGSYKAILMAIFAVERARNLVETIRLIAMFRRELGLLTAAQQAFNITASANPYIATAVAIGTVVSALLLMRDGTTAAERAQQALNDERDRFQKSLSEEREEVERLISVVRDNNATAFQQIDAYERLRKLSPALTEAYSRETLATMELAEARKLLSGEEDDKKYQHEEDELKRWEQRLRQLQQVREDVLVANKAANGSITYKFGDLIGTQGKDFVQDLKALGFENGWFALSDADADKATAAIKEIIQKHREALGELDDLRAKAEEESKPIELRVETQTQLVSDLEAKLAELRGELDAAQKEAEANPKLFKVPLLLEFEFGNVKEALEKEQEKLLSLEAQLPESYQDARKRLRREYDEALKGVKAAEQGSLPEYQKAAERLKAAEKSLSEIGAKPTQAKKKTGDDAKKLREEQAQRELAIKEYYQRLKEEERAGELQLRAQRISLMEEGYEKERQQTLLNYDRQLLENEKREREMIQRLAKVRLEEWLKANPKADKIQQQSYHQSLLDEGSAARLSRKDLSEEQQRQLGAYEELALRQKEEAERESYKRLLTEFQSFEEQRMAVTEEFQKKREALLSLSRDQAASFIKGWAELDKEGQDKVWGAFLSSREGKLSELDRAMQEGLKRIDAEELSRLSEAGGFFAQIFEDLSEKGTRELEELRKKTEELVNYLKETKAEDLMPRFGLSTEQLRALQTSPKEMKALGDQLKRMGAELRRQRPFKALLEDIEALGRAKGVDEVERRLGKLGESASEVAGIVSGFTGQLSALFEAAGKGDFAQLLGGITGAMDSVGNIAKGFAQGGVAGGVMAIASEGLNLVTRALQAEKKHQEALLKVQEERYRQQQRYNLLLLDEKLMLKESSTVFGEQVYRKAANAVGVLRESYEQLQKAIQGTALQQQKFSREGSGGFLGRMFRGAYKEVKALNAGLADIQIKTGHEKTGLFGWGKGRDVFSSILDVYPQLIDGQGQFNKKLAESILETRQFNGSGKEALQNMVALYEEWEKAQEAIKEYLGGVFGSLGNSLSDALVDAFKQGESAADSFADSVGKSLEKLSREMIFSTLFDGILEEANKKMQATMQDGRLSEDQKMRRYIQILDDMTTESLQQEARYKEMMQQYQELASARGFDFFSEDKRAGRKASEKGIAQASQDSVDELNGRMTAVQGHTYLLSENSKILVERSAAILQTLTLIEGHSQGQLQRLVSVDKTLLSVKASVEELALRGVKIRQ